MLTTAQRADHALTEEDHTPHPDRITTCHRRNHRDEATHNATAALATAIRTIRTTSTLAGTTAGETTVAMSQMIVITDLAGTTTTTETAGTAVTTIETGTEIGIEIGTAIELGMTETEGTGTVTTVETIALTTTSSKTHVVMAEIGDTVPMIHMGVREIEGGTGQSASLVSLSGSDRL
jgi:K+-transporting ATPase A subunit